MSQTPDTPNEPRPSPKTPFQFGLKHLMALPVVVAVFFGVGAWLGVWVSVQLLLISLCVAGFYFRVTRLVAGVVVALLLLLLVALLLPAFEHAGPAARRAACQNHLKQLGLALHNYHDVYGCFPPAIVYDEDGRPMHSWRVLILPYIEEQPLYDQYRFDEPWDGPNNRKLAGRSLSIFRCPETEDPKSTMTDYVAVIGPNTVWPEEGTTTLDDITDGSSNTILLVEVKNSGIHWMEPRDLHVRQMAPGINPAAGQGIASRHSGVANVLFADGSVHCLPDDFSEADLEAMRTPAGGEPVESALDY